MFQTELISPRRAFWHNVVGIWPFKGNTLQKQSQFGTHELNFRRNWLKVFALLHANGQAPWAEAGVCHFAVGVKGKWESAAGIGVSILPKRNFQIFFIIDKNRNISIFDNTNIYYMVNFVLYNQCCAAFASEQHQEGIFHIHLSTYCIFPRHWFCGDS